MRLFGQYGAIEGIKTAWYYLLTRIVWPGARLIRRPIYVRGREHLTFCPGFTVGYGCRFDLAGEGKTLVIGRNCRMNDRVHIVAHESVVIGNDVLMASNIFISDTSHGAYGMDGADPGSAPRNRKLVTKSVIIEDNVWIGEGVAILPGVRLGSGCIVGANAVVTKSFPKNTIIAGIPAKAIKRWNSELGGWDRIG